MTVHRSLRLLAGALVLLSVALGYFVHPGWFLLTAFVGLNLFQSAFSDWCPAMTFFRKVGIPYDEHEREHRSTLAGTTATSLH